MARLTVTCQDCKEDMVREGVTEDTADAVEEEMIDQHERDRH